GVAALRRAWALVRGTWWSVFGTVLLAWVLVLIVTLVLNAILGVIVGAIVPSSHPGLHAFALGSIEGLGAVLVFSPFTCAIATVLTVDMRVRKEGLDLELLTDGHAGGAGPGSYGFLPQPKARWAPSPPGTWRPPGAAASARPLRASRDRRRPLDRDRREVGRAPDRPAARAPDQQRGALAARWLVLDRARGQRRA